jgi:hypothetical protein
MNKSLLIFALFGIGIYLTIKNQKEAGKYQLPENLTYNEIDEMAKQALRRGERLNNPLNIEKSANAWQGLAPSQPDSRFASFVSADYGIRAGTKILNTYYNKYNLKTIRAIINRYAPSVENDTNSYVNQVAKNSGIGADSVFQFNEANLFAIVKAMIKHEQGRIIYPDAVIRYGVSLGFK